LTLRIEYVSVSNRLRNRLATDQSGAKRRAATLADVAASAGVSASTASRALNGRGELSAATRAAVIEAAERLGFQPSPLARSLRTRKTYTVGFVVPDVASPFYAASLKGAQAVLEDSGYRVMLMDSELSVDGEVAALRTLVNHRVDGLLVATAGLGEDEFEDLVGSKGTPCVFLDSVVDGAGAGAVTLENRVGIELLVGHLREHGHTRIALLAGSQQETSGVERLEAFAAVARPEPELIRVGPWTQAAGAAGTRELLALDVRPTAIVASSAELGLGCLAACRELGVALPDELALVTFDDPYFGSLLEPALTAVGYDPADVGRAAATLLVTAMREEEGERREVRVPVALVRRRSCGCGGGS
jgi:LacI family transcriptional regulator, galactose operon repressor